MDMRGHGLSDKPREGYDDSRLWADDLNAVITHLNLEQPLVVGWSYGAFVILDYIRHHGDDAVGGINLVGGTTRLGSEAAMSVITPELLSLVPGLFANEAGESVGALESLLRLFFVHEPSADDLFLMLGYNVVVPPFVRQALFSRVFDNDDLLPKIRKPTLITHGAEDAVVYPAVVDQHKAGLALRSHRDPSDGQHWTCPVLGRRANVQSASSGVLREPPYRARPSTSPRIRNRKYTDCPEWVMIDIQVLLKDLAGSAYSSAPVPTDASMPHGWCR